MYPLIKTFKATRLRNAFILNALVAAFTAVFAIEFRAILDEKKSDIYIYINKLLPGSGISRYMKVVIVLLTTFISSFIVYNILHLLFGYGAGMIIDDKFIKGHPVY